MQRSTTGESLLSIRVEAVESIKWVALAVMLVHHVQWYVLGQLPLWGYALGRLVFPLFAIALAVSLSGRPKSDHASVVARLAAFGLFASGGLWLLNQYFPLNVLFTFMLGLLAWAAIRSMNIFGWLLAALFISLASICEFGAAGAAFVVFACAAMETKDFRFRAASLTIGFAGLCFQNSDPFALAALPLALSIDRGGLHLPRVKHLFYWVYALQFPVLYGLKELL